MRLPKKGFKPRRLAIEAPVKKFELPVLAGVNVETFAGIAVSAWPTLTIPRFSIVLESITVVGVEVLKSVVRLMREPVTVTSSRVAGPVPAAAEGAVCACAIAPKPKDSATATLPVRLFANRELNELESIAALTAASIGERVAIIRAPSLRKTNTSCLKRLTAI